MGAAAVLAVVAGLSKSPSGAVAAGAEAEAGTVVAAVEVPQSRPVHAASDVVAAVESGAF